MKKAFTVTFIILFILLTGCSKLQINYVIEDDGTIEVSYILAVKKQDLKEISVKTLLTAAEAQAHTNGFTVSAYNNDGYKGFKAVKSMKNIDLKDPGIKMLGFDELPTIYKKFDWNYTTSILDNSYQLALEVDLSDILDTAILDTLPSDLKASALKAFEQSEVAISFTLPGTSVMTNAHAVNHSSSQRFTHYQWALAPGDKLTLQLEAYQEVRQALDLIYITVAITLGLALLLVLTLVYRRRTKNTRIRNL